MEDLVIEKWTIETFENSRSQWESLLSESDADSLFLSWDWLWTWWQVFGNKGQRSLYLLAALRGDHLVGLAPMYTSIVRTRAGLNTRRLQFLGNDWRSDDNIRTEYCGFIISRQHEKAVSEKFMETINSNEKWDEFVWCNAILDTKPFRRTQDYFKSKGCFVRELEKGESSAVILSGNFEEFLASLSPKTRLKIYNQRKRLESDHGAIELETTNFDNLERHFEILNSFHRGRWDKNVFEKDRLQFHQNLSARLAEKGALDFTILKSNGQPISALYDFKYGDHKYGYQLGFNVSFDKRISLGFLHFGYAIEKAYDQGIKIYDFLRGAGKSSPLYKARLTKPYRSLVTLQIVRSRWLRILYRLYSLGRP